MKDVEAATTQSSEEEEETPWRRAFIRILQAALVVYSILWVVVSGLAIFALSEFYFTWFPHCSPSPSCFSDKPMSGCIIYAILRAWAIVSLWLFGLHHVFRDQDDEVRARRHRNVLCRLMSMLVLLLFLLAVWAMTTPTIFFFFIMIVMIVMIWAAMG